MNRFTGFQKGVNLGGWISQFDRYDKEHFDSFITEDDLKSIAEMGFDHVRVPVDYVVLEDEDGNRREEGYACLDRCREWCAQYSLHMLIDLHECYGYSFDPLKKDDKLRFFYDRQLQERFLALWDRLAGHFAGYPELVAFEPLNEVISQDVVAEWNDLLTRYIQRIRKTAPDTWLVLGGVDYNSVLSVPLINVPADDHIVYNFHCYEPMVFTHQGAYWIDGMPPQFRIGYPKTLEEYREADRALPSDLGNTIFTENIGEIGNGFFEDIFAVAMEKSVKDNVPLYCEEYGVIELAAPEDAVAWIADIQKAFRKFGIGNALWNYKGKDYGLADEKNAARRRLLPSVF
ncbi:MAG: glycoside hydrolase family 5 protein [Lachnospiraceae bacterium]|nr:glycoside hydrolase family 5 protein [Lachnospiraceae bacterium]